MKATATILLCDTEKQFLAKSVSLLEKKIGSYTKDSRLLLGLAGGSTPKPVYEALSKSKKVDWSKIDVFLVDERYVPPDHPESNQKMIREALKRNITAPNTLLPVDLVADTYEKTLSALFSFGGTMLHILGMGEDGHIASIFPGDRKAIMERERIVIRTRTDVFAIHDRITVTLPVLWKADERVFLIGGEKKYEILKRMDAEPIDLLKYPAQEFLGESTTWIVRS